MRNRLDYDPTFYGTPPLAFLVGMAAICVFGIVGAFYALGLFIWRAIA